MPNEELNKVLQGMIDSINELYTATSRLAKGGLELANSVLSLAEQVEVQGIDITMIEENLGLIERPKTEPKVMTEEERNKYISEHLEEHPEWKYEK